MPTKLFVGNLPENCNRDTIHDLFSPYGNIEDIVVLRNYGFVNFTDDGDSANAVKDLDGTKIGGNTVTVEIAKKKERPGDRKDNRDNRNRDRDRGDGQRGRREGPSRSDRSNNRGPDNRGNDNRGNNPGLGLGGPLGGLGNILGAAAGAGGLGGLLGQAPLAAALGGAGGNNPLGGLGILSAVNTLAAVKQQQMNLAQQQQQQQQEQPPQQQHQQREERTQEQSDSDMRDGSQMNNGYVIYERYYVDPSHPLLKGLPLPKLPRIPDSRDSDQYSNKHRDRSPVRAENYHNSELRW